MDRVVIFLKTNSVGVGFGKAQTLEAIIFFIFYQFIYYKGTKKKTQKILWVNGVLYRDNSTADSVKVVDNESFP